MEYNFDNNIPIYVQLSEIIRIEIISGKLKPGEKIPSVRELSIMVKANPNTIQKALMELEKEKLIYTERTNGKYITNDNKLILKYKNKIIQEKMSTFLEGMMKIGIDINDIKKYLQDMKGNNK